MRLGPIFFVVVLVCVSMVIFITFQGSLIGDGLGCAAARQKMDKVVEDLRRNQEWTKGLESTMDEQAKVIKAARTRRETYQKVFESSSDAHRAQIRKLQRENAKLLQSVDTLRKELEKDNRLQRENAKLLQSVDTLRKELEKDNRATGHHGTLHKELEEDKRAASLPNYWDRVSSLGQDVSKHTKRETTEKSESRVLSTPKLVNPQNLTLTPTPREQ